MALSQFNWGKRGLRGWLINWQQCRQNIGMCWDKEKEETCRREELERDSKETREELETQRSKCGLTRSILRNPSGLARPMTETLSFTAQMSIASSFLVSKKRWRNDRMQSSQYGRQSTHWKSLHSTSSKTVVGWWMPCSGQNWNIGILELAPSYPPFWYGATDRYVLEFLYATKFW